MICYFLYFIDIFLTLFNVIIVKLADPSLILSFSKDKVADLQGSVGFFYIVYFELIWTYMKYIHYVKKISIKEVQINVNL